MRNAVDTYNLLGAMIMTLVFSFIARPVAPSQMIIIALLSYIALSVSATPKEQDQ